jgi:hypothetical protein
MRKAPLAYVILGVTASAHAATLYDFSGTYADLFGGPQKIPVHFSLTTPSPVTTDTTFLPGGALTCDLCDRILFYPDATTLSGGTPSSGIGYGVSGGQVFFYFNPGSFTLDGSHVSILLTGINDAVLTVQGASVPEPSSAVPLLFLLAIFALLRRFEGYT